MGRAAREAIGPLPRRSLPGSATAPTWSDLRARLAKATRRPEAPPSEAVVALLAARSPDALATADLALLALAERVIMERSWPTTEASLLPFVASSRGLADAVRVYGGACALDGHRALGWAPPSELRRAVVLASEASYLAGRDVAATLRDTLPLLAAARLAYAFPDEPWAASDLEVWLSDPRHAASHVPVGFLLTACSDLDLVRRYLATSGGGHALASAAADLAATIPAELLLPVLEEGITRLLKRPAYGPVLKTQPRRVAEVVASIGTPEAARVLARFASHPILAPQILAWFRDHPEHTGALEGAATTGSKLSHTAQRIAGKQRRGASGARVAEERELPSVLRERPWTRKPAPSTTLAAPLARRGMELERLDEALLATLEDRELARHTVRSMTEAELEAWRERVRKGTWASVDLEYVYRRGTRGEYVEVPSEEGLAAWNRASTGGQVGATSSLAFLRRHGVAAFPGWIRRDWPGVLSWEGGPEAMRTASVVVSPAIAPAMASVLTDRKQYRRDARAWLLRNPDVAALGLVPEAVGADHGLRRSAEAALLLLASQGARASVERAAAAYGPEASAIVLALLARDPRRTERTVPKRPPILRRDDLPPLRLAGVDAILDAEAVESVLDMLSLSLPDEPYVGLAELRAGLDDASLGAFALELLEQWALGDAPGRSEWMGFSVIHLPSHGSEARLASLAREWSTKNQAKCERASVALAELGTDPALSTLARIASTTRFQKLRGVAAALLAQAAAARGLGVEELEDRTVPELDGADAKERERVMTDVARRLERLLVSGRRLELASFEALFVRHPVVGSLARTLLWEACEPSGERTVTFRIAEDGTYADVVDDEVALPPSTRVRLAHPARPGSVSAAWTERFAEYEIAQAVDQLGRRTHTLAAKHREDLAFAVTSSHAVPAKKLLGLLESRGWRRDAAGHPSAFLRDLGDVRVTLSITPGFEIQDLAHADRQSLGPLTFTRRGETLALRALDPVTLSESVRDAEDAAALG